MTNTFDSNSHQKDEHLRLSDLLDDCCATEEVDQLLASEKQQKAWYRYNLVSAVLKKENSAYSSFEFTQAISTQLEQEPAIISRPQREKNAVGGATVTQLWKRVGGGMAIAASVAYAMVFSVQMMNSDRQNAFEPGIVSSPLESVSPVLESQPTLLTAADLEEQAKLDEIEHILNTMGKRNPNVYEQQVGGEGVMFQLVGTEDDPLVELQKQIDSLDKASQARDAEQK